MSLLSGMNNIFQNTPVMEAATAIAEEELMLNELSQIEADIALEAIIDGENNNPANDDEVDKMVEEDEEEDEIMDELDKADECGECGNECATEAAALTGLSFLRSLTMDINDPIKTKQGSIGQQDSAASFNTNYSSEFDDDNDPIKTKQGSMGIQDGTANHKQNFSDDKKDTNDPIKPKAGSIGQKNTTAKDPAMEGTSFLSMLVHGTPATEATAEPTNPPKNGGNNSHQIPKPSRFINSCRAIGVLPPAIESLNTAAANKEFESVMETLSTFKANVSEREDLINKEDTMTDTLQRAFDYVTTVTEGMMIRTQLNRMYSAAIESGMDKEVAANQAVGKIRGKLQGAIIEGNLNERSQKAIESAIGHFEYAIAKEASGKVKDNDPEATSNGSVGQKDSAAHSSQNYTTGVLDVFDPVKTNDGSEGQQDSAATWPDNHSGGEADTTDPVHTANGSVGQKDSTAKDPAAESSLALDELQALADIMNQDFD